MRKLLEEEDYLKGFQLFVDTDSGFGSFSQEIVKFIKDECGKKSIITFFVTFMGCVINGEKK